MPCRIDVFSGRKRERSPCENPPNDDFVVFSHGALSPRHTKVRDILCVAFSATVCRVFAWRDERSPCENTKKTSFGGCSRGDLSRFRPCLSYLCLAGQKVAMQNTLNGDFGGFSRGGFSRGDLSPRQAKIRQTGDEKATHEKCRTFVWRGEKSPCEKTKKSPFGGFSRGAFSPFRPENTIIGHGTNHPPYFLNFTSRYRLKQLSF